MADLKVDFCGLEVQKPGYRFVHRADQQRRQPEKMHRRRGRRGRRQNPDRHPRHARAHPKVQVCDPERARALHQRQGPAALHLLQPLGIRQGRLPGLGRVAQGNPGLRRQERGAHHRQYRGRIHGKLEGHLPNGRRLRCSDAGTESWAALTPRR